MPDEDGSQFFKQVDEIEDFEDDVMFAAHPGGRDPASDVASEAMEIMSGFFPGKTEWQGKTRLDDVEEANAFVRARYLLREFNDELGEVGENILQAIRDKEMYRTSVDGQSREEYSNILRALAGKDPGEIDSTGGLLGVVQDDLSNDDD